MDAETNTNPYTMNNIALINSKVKKKPHNIIIKNNRNEPKIRANMRYSDKQNYRRLAYPTSAQNLSSVGGFRNYIKECYCCYIQPTDKDYRDVKGPGSLIATVRHRENSNDLPGFEPTSSANRARLRSGLQNIFAKFALFEDRTRV